MCLRRALYLFICVSMFVYESASMSLSVSVSVFVRLQCSEKKSQKTSNAHLFDSIFGWIVF